MADPSQPPRAGAAPSAAREIPELLGRAPDAVLLLDAAANVLDANEEACRSLGYARDALVGGHVRDFVEGLDAARLADIIELMKQRGVATFRARHRRTDGATFPVETRLALLRYPGPPLVVAFIRDLSPQEEAQRALRASETRYQRLLELLPEGVVTFGTDGRITFANAAAARLAGVASARDLVGQPVIDHVHAASRASVLARMERVARGEATPGTDEELVRADGLRYPADVAAAPLGNGESIVVVRDLSERRRVEAERTALAERLRQSEKLEALGTLAGGVAHDFNNVLAAILGHADALAADLGPGGAGREDVEQIAAAARRAKGVVQQILAFARRRPLEPRPLDVARAVEEEASLVRAALPATIRVDLALDRHAGVVRADPTHLHQVLLNLCANARDALREHGGRVVVEVAPARARDPGAPEGLRPGAHVRLTVRDDGHGMDAATRARAFEPYFTTKAIGAGSGLGLSVVHGIAVALGGAVTIESAPGHGTAVSVWLPCDGAAAPAPAPVRRPATAASARLLLVEDDPPVARALSRMLETLGYEVVVSGNGAEALARFRADPGGFDLVLTDQTLPGLRGDELVPELLAVRADLPILLCTGYSERVDDERARALGARAFLLKPLDLPQLADAVRAALAR